MPRKRLINSARSKHRFCIAPIVALPHPHESGFCSSCRRAISMNTSVGTVGHQPAPRPIPTVSILGYQEPKSVSVWKAPKEKAHPSLGRELSKLLRMQYDWVGSTPAGTRFIPLVRGQFLPRSASQECSPEWGRRSSRRRALDRRLLVE